MSQQFLISVPATFIRTVCFYLFSLSFRYARRIWRDKVSTPKLVDLIAKCIRVKTTTTIIICIRHCSCILLSLSTSFFDAQLQLIWLSTVVLPNLPYTGCIWLPLYLTIIIISTLLLLKSSFAQLLSHDYLGNFKNIIIIVSKQDRLRQWIH